MPLIFKLCCVFLLIATLRCPVVAQQVSARLACQSVDCTEGNSLVKFLDRKRYIDAAGSTTLSVGVSYNRSTFIESPGAQRLEKYYRMGIPLLAGFKLGEHSTLQVGGFVGMEMVRPQWSFWFARPNASGLSAGEYAPSAGLLVGLGWELPKMGELHLRYFHDENNFGDALGNMQLGWRIRW
jgi:hypothetical protein